MVYAAAKLQQYICGYKPETKKDIWRMAGKGRVHKGSTGNNSN